MANTKEIVFNGRDSIKRCVSSEGWGWTTCYTRYDSKANVVEVDAGWTSWAFDSKHTKYNWRMAISFNTPDIPNGKITKLVLTIDENRPKGAATQTIRPYNSYAVLCEDKYAPRSLEDYINPGTKARKDVYMDDGFKTNPPGYIASAWAMVNDKTPEDKELTTPATYTFNAELKENTEYTVYIVRKKRDSSETNGWVHTRITFEDKGPVNTKYASSDGLSAYVEYNTNVSFSVKGKHNGTSVNNFADYGVCSFTLNGEEYKGYSGYSSSNVPYGSSFSLDSVNAKNGYVHVGTYNETIRGITSTNYCEISFEDLYTVTYNLNGGTGTFPNQTFKYSDKSVTLINKAPTKTGYTFKGWSKTSGGTTADYTKGSTYSTLSSVTLYAVWAKDSYTVNYNSNGGDPNQSMSSSEIKYGEAFTTSPCTFTKFGYTWKAWNESADGSGVWWNKNSQGVYESGEAWTWTYTHDITLYAQWEKRIYTVIYNVDGKTYSNTVSVGDTLLTGSDVVKNTSLGLKSHYKFVRWETADGVTISSVNDVITKCGNSNSITLTAVIEPRFKVIRYNSNDKKWHKLSPIRFDKREFKKLYVYIHK